jgi:glycosyltransferase involved in cell wall biosynthesis
MRTILMNWQLNSTFGWGILGLNLLSQWAHHSAIQPVMGYPITDSDLAALDPLCLAHLLPAMQASNRYLAALRPDSSGQTRIPGIVIDAIGNDLASGKITGQYSVGRVIYDDTTLPDAHRKLAHFDALLCGSSWNAQRLRYITGRDVKVIHEGVDISLFFPGPRACALDPNRFYIFSGGKIEFRKGQDLTLKAFRAFGQRHPDAILVTAWHSPWPILSAGFKGCLSHPLRLTSEGRVDVYQWVADNGINPAQVIDIGPVPNPAMPTILRSMDVCLQPSRAEPCTSLPVKEAMACGLPVIAAANTGMLDLLTAQNCLPLTRQYPVRQAGKEGWGESDVEEMVEKLEWVYTHREEAKRLGHDAASWIGQAQRTWQHHGQQLLSWLGLA